MVDCLNHLAKEKLGWRTSQEVLNGDTADLSPFRFTFWEEIEYYEPTAKFPQTRWRNGWFIGIAWTLGDEFTFYIWTDPGEEGWQKGRELTRNLVRRRPPRKNIQKEILKLEDYSQFKFQKMIKTRKRRGRRREIVGQLRDLDEVVIDEDESEGMIGGAQDPSMTKRSQIQDEDMDSTIVGGKEEENQDAPTNHTNTQNQNLLNSTDGTLLSIEDAGQIQSVDEVNEHFSS